MIISPQKYKYKYKDWDEAGVLIGFFTPPWLSWQLPSLSVISSQLTKTFFGFPSSPLIVFLVAPFRQLYWWPSKYSTCFKEIATVVVILSCAWPMWDSPLEMSIFKTTFHRWQVATGMPLTWGRNEKVLLHYNTLFSGIYPPPRPVGKRPAPLRIHWQNLRPPLMPRYGLDSFKFWLGEGCRKKTGKIVTFWQGGEEANL